MSKRLDLPVKDIIRLRDDLELTFKEIRDALNLDCHVNTVRRHYYRAKEEAEFQVMMNELNAKEEEIKSAWQKFVDWLRGLFRK